MDLSADRSRLDYFISNPQRPAIGPPATPATSPNVAAVQGGCKNEGLESSRREDECLSVQTAEQGSRVCDSAMMDWKHGEHLLNDSFRSKSPRLSTSIDLTGEMTGDEYFVAPIQPKKEAFSFQSPAISSDSKLKFDGDPIATPSTSVPAYCAMNHAFSGRSGARNVSTHAVSIASLERDCDKGLRSGLKQSTSRNQLCEDVGSSDLLADVNVNEQAALMAIFEAQRRVSQEVKEAAASNAASQRNPGLVLAEKDGTARDNTSWANNAANMSPAVRQPAGKRQRTLLGFFGIS